MASKGESLACGSATCNWIQMIQTLRINPCLDTTTCLDEMQHVVQSPTRLMPLGCLPTTQAGMAKYKLSQQEEREFPKPLLYDAGWLLRSLLACRRH